MRAPAIPPALRAINGQGYGLQLRFVWKLDRFAHVIEVCTPQGDEADWALAAESKESSPDEDWPSSPPLQQVSVERIAEHDVALAVGCAGSSHFSLSISPTEEQGLPAFDFDVAVRCGSTPERIGSTYLSLKDCVLFSPLSDIAATQLQCASDRVEVFPELLETTPVRWAYRVGLRF